MSIDTGDIVEFESGDDYVLGSITRELGQKFIVVTEEGDEMRPAGDEISFTFDESLDASSSDDRIQSKLQTLRAELDAIAADVDVELLWEFVKEADQTVTAEDLSMLYFESTAPRQVWAVLRRLREDVVHFKDRKSGFEPRSPEKVETVKQQRRAEKEREQKRTNFIEEVADVFDHHFLDRQEAAEAKMGGADFRQYAELLQGYAIHDRDYDDRDEALDLLDDIEDELDHELQGRFGDKAFWLMVEMGLWDEHENLWLHRFNLEDDPDESVLEAARAIEAHDWTPESHRRDLTDRYCFSIDDPGTEDIDDALSCRRRDEGGWEIGVHIADPSAHIESGDALDEYARDRGTSIYLPQRTIPMLPRQVSEGAVSLNAGRRRPALSTLIEVDADGEIVDWTCATSVVEVDERLTYDDADQLLAGDQWGKLADALETLSTVAEQRKAERADRGGVNIDLAETEIEVEWHDGQPRVRCRAVEQESPSHDVVGELMVLTNRLMAEFCDDHDIPVIYREQEPPEGELIDEEVESQPEGLPRTFSILYKMKPSSMTLEPNYHFGLGLPRYAQATSPIRRYGDLVCQRQIKAFLADDPLPYDHDEMLQILATVEETAREASRTQSETQRYWILEYLRQRKDDGPMEATIIHHKNDDGTLASIWLDDIAFKCNGRFRTSVPPGETAEVVVDRADPRQDELSIKQA